MPTRCHLSPSYPSFSAITLPRSPLAALNPLTKQHKKHFKPNKNKTTRAKYDSKPTERTYKQQIQHTQEQCPTERRQSNLTHKRQASAYQPKHRRVQSALTREDEAINSDFSFEAMHMISPMATEQNAHTFTLTTVVERVKKTFEGYASKLNATQKQLTHLRETNRFLQRKLEKIKEKKRK